VISEYPLTTTITAINRKIIDDPSGSNQSKLDFQVKEEIE
jgi:hypothetical protein